MRNSTAISASRAPAGDFHVVVIGAGIGGLVAALLLASRGLAVTVLERAETPGGKLRRVRVGEALIDCGPTVFTLRSLFEDIFAEAGATLSAHLRLIPAGILARHAWRAGEVLDLHADLDQAVDAIGRFAGAAEAQGYRAFCAEARRIYRALERPFIHADRPSLAGLVGELGLGRDLFGITPFRTLWSALGDYFKDPRLRQLFGRYATYCGSSPFRCPATLMLVAHVEQAGVWLVEGGMHELGRVMADLARSRGASIRYAAEARTIRVERGRVTGVDLASGERLDAGAVVCNADVAALAGGLLGTGARRAGTAVGVGRRSLSAMTFAFSGTVRDFPLLRHNVFFSGDYAAEFNDLLRRRRVPQSPTVYVCAQDRDAAGGLAAGTQAERLFCIVNAPPVGDTQSFDASEIARCETSMVQTLTSCGLRVEPDPAGISAATPNDFHRLFPATGGALYGAASHGWTASFRRRGVRSRVPGLYLCGGSVHPGPGLPMAALSGRMAAASLAEDLI